MTLVKTSLMSQISVQTHTFEYHATVFSCQEIKLLSRPGILEHFFQIAKDVMRQES